MLYEAKMNVWTHSQDYPVSKTFYTKKQAVKYINLALKIYPYAEITLSKYPKTGKAKRLSVYRVQTVNVPSGRSMEIIETKVK